VTPPGKRGTGGPGRRRPALPAGRSLDLVLGATTLIFAVGAATRTGIERAFFAVVAFSMGLVLLLHVTQGTRAHRLARLLAGLGGLVLMAGALGMGALSVWLVTGVGGVGILAAMVSLPAACVVGMWGWTLMKIGLEGR